MTWSTLEVNVLCFLHTLHYTAFETYLKGIILNMYMHAYRCTIMHVQLRITHTHTLDCVKLCLELCNPDVELTACVLVFLMVENCNCLAGFPWPPGDLSYAHHYGPI